MSLNVKLCLSRWSEIAACIYLCVPPLRLGRGQGRQSLVNASLSRRSVIAFLRPAIAMKLLAPPSTSPLRLHAFTALQ